MTHGKQHLDVLDVYINGSKTDNGVGIGVLIHSFQNRMFISAMSP